MTTLSAEQIINSLINGTDEPVVAAPLTPDSAWPFPSPPVRQTAPVRTVARKRKTPVATEELPAPFPPTTHVATPWPVVTEYTDTPLAYTVGIELTMMPQILSGKGNSADANIATRYASIMENFLDAKKEAVYKMHSRDPHRDQFCVECPSKPFKKWGEVKKFYDNYSKLMLDIGLLPHNSKVSSGGGHIHTGPLKTPHMINILRDVQNKPWLMWTFNEPDDNTSAVSATVDLAEISDTLKHAAATINVDPSLFTDEVSEEGMAALVYYGNPAYISNSALPDNKGRSMRYVSSIKTLEFRFFEAPANWEEQEAHIRFVQAYAAYIEKTYKDKWVEVTVHTPSQLTAMKVGECEKNFRDLLDTLDLPHAPYERMIKENLHQRFKRGKRV